MKFLLCSIVALFGTTSFALAQDVRSKQTPRDVRKLLGIDNGLTPFDDNKWDIYEAHYAHIVAGNTITIAHSVRGLDTEYPGFIPNTPPGVYKCYPTQSGPMMVRIR